MTKITCTINNVEEGDIIQDYAPTDIRNKNELKYLIRQIIGIQDMQKINVLFGQSVDTIKKVNALRYIVYH